MDTGELLAGKYRIERVLGEGGMGRVVAAVHEALGQRVAIKFLLPRALEQPEAVARFLREARAAVQLKSEHVGRVIDVGTLDGGEPYMVMEYLEGSDLATLLDQRGPLPVPVAVEYLLQACEAIAEAHSRGIVHRDIKPANLFLTWRADASPLIKVLDFGIAKAASADRGAGITSTEAVLGSPGYMSPEQLRSARAVDSRTDIWSLGVVLYELVADRRPFDGKTFSEVCIQVATEPMPPLPVPGLPLAFEAVVARCLEKEPAARFPHVAALAAALEPFASDRCRGSAAAIARVLQLAPVAVRGATTAGGDTPTTLSGATAATTSSSPPSSRRGLRFALATAAVAAVAVAVALVLAHHPTKPAVPAAGASPAVKTLPLAAADAGAAPARVAAQRAAVAPDAHAAAGSPAKESKPVTPAAQAAAGRRSQRPAHHARPARRAAARAHRGSRHRPRHRDHARKRAHAAGGSGLNLDSRE